MDIYIGRIAYPVTSLGPGRRLVLWTSGCCRRCPGCISPELLVAGRSEHRIPVADLVSRILSINIPLDGITISGGDPLDQAAEICELLIKIMEARPEWNVLCYTGYLLEQLSNKEQRAALGMIDLLIDGPYRREIPTDHPLKGSGNQQFHALSEEGRAMMKELEDGSAGRPCYNYALGSRYDLLVGVGTPETRACAHKQITTKGE